MKLEPKELLSKIGPILQKLKKYVMFIFVILMLLIFSFLIFRINGFSRVEPDNDALQQKLSTVQRPKVDQSVLDKIQVLQDQNLQVQSLFTDVRNNPFSECLDKNGQPTTPPNCISQ